MMTPSTATAWRILVVEDELDWQTTMALGLRDACRERSLPLPRIDSALDAAAGRRLLVLNAYHLVSLDMRLPAKPSDSVDVVEGIRLAESSLSPIASLPKTILYTATLSQEETSKRKEILEGLEVVERLPGIDKYAKSSGADAPERLVFEILDQRQWGERVLDYLHCDELSLTATDPRGRPYRSALGAWLAAAAVALPPLLARQVQEMENAWPQGGGKVNALALDAGLKFVEAALRLAVAQTAVLRAALQHGAVCPPPADDTLTAPIQLLREWCRRDSAALAGSAWRQHLTDEAIEAFDAARRLRNDMRHNLRAGAVSAFWSKLLPLLRQIMDVAAYWAKHPLCVDLRYGRDGWSGELLAGTAWPRPLRPLPEVDFPGAASAGCWQSAAFKDDKPPGWRLLPVCWDDWLRRDAASERAYWLKSHRGRRGEIAVEIDTGEPGLFPDPAGRPRR